VTAGPRPGAPCGICRQVLAEFARDMRLLLVAEDDRGRVLARKSARLAALLPQAFRLTPPRR
jgi:cytidine deaminase